MTRIPRWWPAALLVAGTLAMPIAPVAAQCPMCRQALEGDQAASGDDGLATGMAWSIYLMVALPYLTLGTIMFLVWRAWRPQPAGRERNPIAEPAPMSTAPAPTDAGKT